MKMQAYLGPNKPETLAEGEGNPDHPYAVVKDSAYDGLVWMGTFPDEASATAAVDDAFSIASFGMLCLVRPASQQYSFHRGIPVAIDHSDAKDVA